MLLICDMFGDKLLSEFLLETCPMLDPEQSSDTAA